MKGDCTWYEQFNYIYICIKEIVKMKIQGDNYRAGV